MTKITTYNKGIIIDGHADTKEECETITLLCDSLAKDSNFKQVAYDKGYAAFQKVGKTNNLMFPPSYSLTVSFDSGIESVAFNHGSDTYTFLRSGETYEFIRRPGSNVILDVTLKNSYGLKSTTLGTISNNTITIPEDEFVEFMTCQITSVAAPTVVRKSYDLSTSAKWATLSSGNHNVQIVAKASGYRDSEKSAAVTVNKPTATVTLEAGTYKFASSPVFTDPNVTLSADFAFSSIGVNYINVTVQYDTETYWSITYHSSSTSSNTAYSTDPDFGGWVDISMRTITLSAAQAVSADFYKWAITDGNLVKQVEPTGETWLLNKTIDTSKSVNITSNISCTINLLTDNQGNYISKSGTIINVFGGAGGPYIIDVDSSGNRLVYYDALGGWNSQYDSSYYKTNDTSKLRTITFATPPTGDLLTWLQANGTKQ